MKRLLSVAIIACIFFISASAEAGPTCTKGKPCGDSCIAQDKECHIAPKPAKQCTKGKLCGDTCIAQDKVCTK